MLRYTVLRILIFFGCFLILWLLGWRDTAHLAPLVLVSALASMVISFFVLKGFRQQYSEQVAEKLQRRKEAHATKGPGQHDEDDEDAETNDADFR